MFEHDTVRCGPCALQPGDPWAGSAVESEGPKAALTFTLLSTLRISRSSPMEGRTAGGYGGESTDGWVRVIASTNYYTHKGT